MPRPSSRPPREWLQNPRSFGGEQTPSWKSHEAQTKGDDLMLRAAQLQHVVVLALHRMEPHLNSKALARELGAISYQQLRKIISGQAHMSFRDLVMLSDHFGPLLILSEAMRDEVGALPNGWLFPTRAEDVV